MVNPKESKQIRMDSQLLKLQSRDMKTKQNKNKDQLTIIKKTKLKK